MRTYLILFILLLLIVSVVKSQNEKRVAMASRIINKAPEIDGLETDEAWALIDWHNQFTQYDPKENAIPSRQTCFKILYDNNYLYVLIKAFEENNKDIVIRNSRRDNLYGDKVGIQLDSYNDKMTAFAFRVSASGGKADYIITEDGNNSDWSWDAIWTAKTSISADGWYAEIKIPLSQLRFSLNDNMIWGIQVERFIYRLNETSYWQPVTRDNSGWVHNFGELRGLENLIPKKQIEIQPYSLAKIETYHKNSENPFSKGIEKNASLGMDGKIGLTNDLTLDFTLNPDFGQVEADPSEVNLSSFESYFAEQRPFFVEGKNIMSFQLTPGDNGASSDNLFYSRRIGRAPQVWPDDSDYENAPANTTILGATKLTGKTKNGISVGILECLTGKEITEFVYQGVHDKITSEPLTNYLVARMQKDFNKGKTRLGAMFTSSNRDLGKNEALYLHKAAYSGGLDYNTSWKEKSYQLNMKIFGSKVEGSRQSILRTQKSGVHYLQRPDAKYLKLDTSKTSLMGYGGIIEFSKSGNGHWSFGGWVNWRSPGLELNDIGYLRRADDIFQVAWANYRFWEPRGSIKSFSINFNQWTGWDFGGNSTYKGGNTSINLNFLSGWYFGSGINYEGNDLDYSALKGGPSLLSPGNFNYWTYIRSDSRKKIWFEVNPYGVYGFNKFLTRNGISFGTNYQPTQTLALNISAGYSKQINNFQYIDQTEFNMEKQYIVGKLNQETFRLSFRAEYSVTPELTIQYYGQPFISAGKFNNFKKIISPRANNYNDRFIEFNQQQITYLAEDSKYAIDENMDGTEDFRFSDRDYKALYFLSNMVLRWEYKPGSTLFLVWSQNRDNYLNNGEFDLTGDIRNLNEIFPGNVFLIKFSYRFLS